jgi:hypothetical protein
MFFPDAPLAKMSASSLPSTSGRNNDIVINKTTATSMISLDNMIDPDFEELDKGDTSKMDINEVLASVVRARYIRSVGQCNVLDYIDLDTRMISRCGASTCLKDS